MSRTLMDLVRKPMGPITPENGRALVYNSVSDLLELAGYSNTEIEALIAAIVPKVIVVADAAALAAAVPAFVGQLAVQLDTGELYYGDDDEAGDWAMVTATAAE